MPRKQADLIAAWAAACADSCPSAFALQVLDAAMQGHTLTAPDFSAAPPVFIALALAASESDSLFLPRMQPLDFLRGRYGLQPDQPARDGLEWRNRVALVLVSNCDAWLPGEPRVRGGLDGWAVELHAAYGATESPERVAMRIVAAQRGGRLS